MAVTTAFINTCRAQVVVTGEYTAFNTAQALYANAARADRARYWYLTYGDNQTNLSPAYRLRKVIRDTITAGADATVTASDRETIYQILVDNLVPRTKRPATRDEDAAGLATLLTEGQL